MPSREKHRPSRRPRTSPGVLPTRPRPDSVQQAVTAEDQAVPDGEEEEHFELLEYEWPDLPPIPSMKDAVSRSRVSRGISYLLPVDKGRNSINNRFRTDLRAMFQEPYASDDLQYDDNRVKLSAKVHFLSNSADTRWTPQLLRTIPTQLNADSDAVRKLYVHSAPSGGRGRVGIDPGKLRKRSNLYLPVKASKAQVSPEIVKLREEAAAIIKQGLSYDEDMNPESTSNQRRATLTVTKTLAPSGTQPGFFPSNVRAQQHSFSTYDELRSAQAPRPVIPKEIESPFLTADLNQSIWEWLHYGESMSEFDYFLSVCG
ncbi:hypothetical protein EGW08_001265 [Elysia chlorotica]|uniref:Uncharacterized protein n=1 Tax=Elysia chlorotica TaxID=188477 RepID=A0A433UAX8_ELYCH|nr:hypothetical protein EGW08_001265 [Elysia chlorotica]